MFFFFHSIDDWSQQTSQSDYTETSVLYYSRINLWIARNRLLASYNRDEHFRRKKVSAKKVFFPAIYSGDFSTRRIWVESNYSLGTNHGARVAVCMWHRFMAVVQLLLKRKP